MRQKFQMIRDEDKNILKIREYAVIDKNLKNVATANLREMDFALIHEEIYDGSFIENAIADSENLIEALRTETFFPVSSYAAELAEAVTGLYGSGKDAQTELFFDDKSLMA